MLTDLLPLEIIRCYHKVPIPGKILGRLARLLYKKEGIPFPRVTCVIFCSDSAIRSLNARYRKIDQVTDVLSFSFCEADLLGEIYISPRRAGIQAGRYGWSRQKEILRLFIHGFYHLLGYDHRTECEYKKMSAKEKTAFRKLVD